MSTLKKTRESLPPRRSRSAKPKPGVLLVHSASGPVLSAVAVKGKAEIVLGRASTELPIDDDLTSRQHAGVRFEGGRWGVRDLESKNGTFVDGVRVDQLRDADARVVRIGHSLFVLLADVTPYVGRAVTAVDGRVMGPALQDLHAKIARFGRIGDTLHINGPSGAGKELAARAFHASGPHPDGPFVAVNCAAIPDGVAERLLFGAVRGAFSGAEDTEGYIQAAHKGTLFLDELAELDLKVQAKLLRVLESKEVMRLGAARPTRVEMRVVSATHGDLRGAAGEGRFREDLYFRIARPAIALPPLRERLEEIPWFVERALASISSELVPEVELMEACLLRPWPGNVRELLGEIERAAHEALAEDRVEVTAEDLDELAGRPWTTEPSASAAPRSTSSAVDREAVEKALTEENGNISAAARRLGLHRTQLRRLMMKMGLDRS